METLNRDCLSMIFSYFSLQERLKLERVCSHWKDMMPYQDCHSSYPTWDILALIKWKPHQIVHVRHGPCAYCDKDTIAYISQAYLLKALTFFLSRFGKSLKNVTFNSSCSLACLVTPEILGHIPSFCQNATSLEFTRCLVMDTALKILSEKYTLKSLVINYCTFIDSDQCGTIDGCALIMEAIAKSAKTLQVLDLRGIKGAKLQFSRNHPVNGALTKLILIDCYVSSTDLDALIASNNGIEHLEITSCLSVLRYDMIANLSRLCHLIMRQSMITVADFQSICQNCKIDRLLLEMCPRLNDLSALKDVRTTLKQLSVIGRSLFIGDHVLEDLVKKGGAIQSIEILDSTISNEAFRRLVPFARGVKIMVRGTGITDATANTLQECGNTLIRMGFL